MNLTIQGHDFAKIYNVAGSSTLLDLSIGEEKPRKVLVHDIQVNLFGRHRLAHFPTQLAPSQIWPPDSLLPAPPCPLRLAPPV